MEQEDGDYVACWTDANQGDGLRAGTAAGAEESIPGLNRFPRCRRPTSTLLPPPTNVHHNVRPARNLPLRRRQRDHTAMAYDAAPAKLAHSQPQACQYFAHAGEDTSVTCGLDGYRSIW